MLPSLLTCLCYLLTFSKSIHVLSPTVTERFCDFLHGFQDEHVREEGGCLPGARKAYHRGQVRLSTPRLTQQRPCFSHVSQSGFCFRLAAALSPVTSPHHPPLLWEVRPLHQLRTGLTLRGCIFSMWIPAPHALVHMVCEVRNTGLGDLQHSLDP